MLGSTVGLTWAPNYAAYVSLRFLVGASCAGIFMTAFVTGMEFVGPSKRLWVGMVNKYFFALGMVRAWSLNIGNLGGNFYLNIIISGLVEFPAVTLCILLLNRLGRKKLHCGSMLLRGIACLITIFNVQYGGDELQPVTVTVAMIGKLGSPAAFGIIYIFSAELYPTVVRNTSIGPYVVDLGRLIDGDFRRGLPLLVFGGASVAAGVFSLFLPETLNRNLPEKIEDGFQLGRSNRRDYDKEGYINNGYSGDYTSEPSSNETKL